MASIQVDHHKCDLCGTCINVCPFNAIHKENGRITIDAACKLCRQCIKACPQGAISLSQRKKSVDKSQWRGILVYAEYVNHSLHPVTIELIGKASELAEKTHMPVYVLLIGSQVKTAAVSLLPYGVDKIFVYDHEALEHFRVDTYAQVFESLINEIKPSVVLVGGTSIGRSLAPRVAVRFKTGLTADCTTLDIKDNSDLVQIRPAFGGNIMAQIVTPHTRPQFATVRYKVMDKAKIVPIRGNIIEKKVDNQLLRSSIHVIRSTQKEKLPSITEAEVLVVAGQGIKAKEDMKVLEQLAQLLGGQLACTRPIVEKGWCDYTKQIGLSGRTVKPRLIITCGVSGAIQFTACMNTAECVVAINTDENAPIFEIAHYGIVGDLYDIVPKLVKEMEGGSCYAV